MTRLRIVELPMVHIGEETETPFVVILDQAAKDSPLLAESDRFMTLAKGWGARGAFVTTDTIEIADEMPSPEPITLVGDADGGHRFGEPGYLDPPRCSQCGLDRQAWYFGKDRRTCAEVQQAKAAR